MSTVVFACLKCRKQVNNFEELSTSQQLCKACRQKYPVTSCKFCRTDFHLLQSTDRDPLCTKCEDYSQRYGQPKCCSYCNLTAAFKGPICYRCKGSQKKYGNPVQCETCKVNGAFRKPEASRRKVGYKTLCFVCTLAYVRAVQRNKSGSPHALSNSTVQSDLQPPSSLSTISASLRSTPVQPSSRKHESIPPSAGHAVRLERHSGAGHSVRHESSHSGAGQSSRYEYSHSRAAQSSRHEITHSRPDQSSRHVHTGQPSRHSASSSQQIRSDSTASQPSKQREPSVSHLVPPPKKRKLENGATYSTPKAKRIPSTEQAVAFSSVPPVPAELDLSSTPAADRSLSMWLEEPANNVSMVTSMSEKVATLEKQVRERDQQLLEKERKMTELKASERDTEKLLRGKLVAVQKQLDSVQMENYSLRKQVQQLTKSCKDKEKELDRERDRVRERDRELAREREKERERERQREKEELERAREEEEERTKQAAASPSSGSDQSSRSPSAT